MKDDELTQKWEDFIGRQNWKAKSYSYVCGNHFQPSDYCHQIPSNVNRMRLKKNSVPSIFERSNVEITTQKRSSAPDDFSLSPAKLKAVALEFHNYAKPYPEEPTIAAPCLEDSIVDDEILTSLNEEATGIDIAST